MKNIRNNFLIKPISILMAILTLNLTFYSCSKDDDSDNNNGNNNNYEVPEKQFYGNAIDVQTDEQGRYNVNSEISSQSEDFDLSYEFKVRDQLGNPVEAITITYNQIGEKSIIYINDEQGRYASTFFIGTPREMEAYFAGSAVKTGPLISNDISFEGNPGNVKSEEFVVLAIVAIVTVLAVGAAEVGFILNAYKVQEFYLTDYVTETEDYILYCKNFEEIAELISARTMMVLNLTSIFISFISLGGSGTSLAIELTNAGGMFTAEHIRNELLNQAIEAWGVSMDQIVGRKVAVKVFPYEEDQSFSNARNLFATYTIEYDNEICYGEGNISGTIVDAETGYGIEDVIVKLSGEDNSTDLTNSEGEYSFEGLTEGDYKITAEKNGYISEVKDINFDGSSAEVNFVLSKTIATDEYRIVLTWGEEPEDMDIHLYTENGDHIYWSNQGSLTSYPYIYLDVDDLHSFGPETITIAELQASSVYVHNYSEFPDIKESEANIKLYNGNSLIREYNVPTSGSGFWWHVFDISDNGNITEQNYLLDLESKTINRKK